MLCTVTAEPLPLGDGPFLDLTFARCAPKMWEGDRICCVGQILPATQVRSLGETKRKNVFSTSPREIETVAQKPIKTRRTGVCTCSLPETPVPGVFLNAKERRFSSIANALRAAAEGDTILLSSGVHICIEPLVMDKRNVTITHSDDAETACPSSSHPVRDCNPSHSVAIITASSSCAVHLKASGCVLRGVAVKLDGHGGQQNECQHAPAARSPSHMCIAVDGDDSLIEHCNVEGGHGAGIVIRGHRSAIRSCTIHGCSQTAVSCFSESSPEIAASSFMLNLGRGIALHDGCGGTIRDNFIFQSGGSGIECLDRSRPTIRDNHILDGLATGVWLRGSSTPTVVGNRLLRNALAGVRVSDESDPRVEANRVCDGRQSGVVIEGRARGSFVRNSMYGQRQCGVRVGGASQPFLIGNSLTGNEAGGALLEQSCHAVWVQNQVQRNQVVGVGVRGAATLSLTRDVVEGNGGSGLCLRGAAALSAELCVVRDNVGAGVRCWDESVANLARCRVDGAGGRARQSIGLFCGARSRVDARRCAFSGHSRANVAANQAPGGGGALSGCRILGAAGEGVLLCGEGAWRLRQNRLQDNATAGVRCSGRASLRSDGDVVERTAGAGLQADGRSSVVVRNMRVVGNREDGVVLLGGASVSAEQSLVQGNGGVGVRAHGDGGSALALHSTCVVANAKGALSAGKAPALRVHSNIFSGPERGSCAAATAPVVLEGWLGPHQAFEHNVADGFTYLSASGGGWKSAAPGAHGSNVVQGAAHVRRQAARCVEEGLVCRCWAEGAATVQMPDGCMFLATKAEAEAEGWAPMLSVGAKCGGGGGGYAKE